MLSSLIGYGEEFDIDSEIREQQRVLDREIISSDFYFNRLPLTAVLKMAQRETRLKAGR